MKKAYSEDMRELALSKYEKGITKKVISEELNISIRTIFYWIREYKLTGRKKPIGYGMRALGKLTKKRQIKNYEKFEEFMKKNSFLTKKQLAEKWTKETGEKVTARGIDGAIKKIGYTFKRTTKRYYQCDEKKRKTFLEKSEELKGKKFFF